MICPYWLMDSTLLAFLGYQGVRGHSPLGTLSREPKRTIVRSLAPGSLLASPVFHVFRFIFSYCVFSKSCFLECKSMADMGAKVSQIVTALERMTYGCSRYT